MITKKHGEKEGLRDDIIQEMDGKEEGIRAEEYEKT